MAEGSAFSWFSCVSEVYLVDPLTAHAYSRRRGPPTVRRWALDVERRLDRLLSYPQTAAATRARGEVQVEFAVGEAAGLRPVDAGLCLVRSSAFASLDDAALEAVRALPLLPDVPIEAQGRQVLVRASFGEP